MGTTIEGIQPGAAQVQCVAVIADGTYRPPLGTHRPHVSGIEPATVVGPPGDEIHTDEFGRVLVQFHWDREGAWDPRSSCWVPVSSAWAGDGYGSLMLPRVGHEVTVEFLGGDPDRPIITGRVYSHLHPAPRPLPQNKSVSVVARSRTLGGTGYNEIAFDDAAGSELFSTHAERDADEKVGREKRVHVGERFVLDVGPVVRDAVTGKPSGGSTIEVTPTAIRIHSPYIEVIASGDHVVRGDRVLINCDDAGPKKAPVATTPTPKPNPAPKKKGRK